MQIHAAPVFAPPRIQENIPGELFMYWFRARGYSGTGSGRLRVQLGDRLGKPMGLLFEPFLKSISRANSSRGQPSFFSVKVPLGRTPKVLLRRVLRRHL